MRSGYWSGRKYMFSAHYITSVLRYWCMSVPTSALPMKTPNRELYPTQTLTLTLTPTLALGLSHTEH